MRNITVAVPEQVYREARIGAAERGTPVSALVAEFLRSLSESEAEFARLEALQNQVQSEIGEFSAAQCLRRDQVHQREVR